MYKIIALMGESGAGKDTVMKGVLNALQSKEPAAAPLHEMIKYTTRPIRENEINGINYYFCSVQDFVGKVAKGEMMEYACFNNWFYGTGVESLVENGINIGVFNPSGIRQLLSRDNCEVYVCWIKTSDKQRLMRQLNREDNPDVKEIIRRFNADSEDFSNIDFNCVQIDNNTIEDFDCCLDAILSLVDSLAASGQN
jgi:guanylate kinase